MSRSGALTVERPSAPRPQTAPWPPPPRTARAARSLRLAGVVLRADLSCVFGALLTAWTFASGFLPETDPGRSTTAYWTAGLVGALLVIASLLLHEIGHAIAARRAGLGVARITLSFVGGTSEIVGAIRYARDEFLIAAAGPLTSLAAAAVAAVVHVVIVETAGPGLPATVAALVGVANLAVALLNAVPGLPLDGGRVLRAAVWAVTGRPETATRVAAVAGRRFGELLIAMAVLASAFGFVALALWAALLGFVLREN
jgi:Zn-dependent protease